jgi:transcriptional regulator with XRE-family HTH domain
VVTDPDYRRRFSARLNAALDDIGVPQKGKGRQLAVAKLFGVSQKGARKWLEGEAVPGRARLAAICERANVSPDWLLTGRGERGLPPAPPADERFTEARVNDHAPRYIAPTLPSLLDALAARVDEAHPLVRADAARLVESYLERPEARSRLLLALEQLLNPAGPAT